MCEQGERGTGAPLTNKHSLPAQQVPFGVCGRILAGIGRTHRRLLNEVGAKTLTELAKLGADIAVHPRARLRRRVASSSCIARADGSRNFPTSCPPSGSTIVRIARRRFLLVYLLGSGAFSADRPWGAGGDSSRAPSTPAMSAIRRKRPRASFKLFESCSTKPAAS